MHDFKYRAIAWTPVGDRRWDLRDFRSECLHRIAVAFLTNLQRTSSFALMPAHLAWLARLDQLWTDYIDIMLGRSINPESKNYSPRISYEEAQVIRPFLEKFCTLSESDAKGLINNVGIAFVEHNLESDEDMRESMMAVLSTIVLESWTAFESVVSDLWVVGVDKAPKDVRLRIANSTRLLKPDDNIGAKELLDVEFDPSSNYGSSLRELGRVSFQKLDYIKRFYSIAFDHDFGKMFSEVENGYINALAAFRNALIHNAGKADKKFVKNVQSFEEFRTVKPKDTLLLDGEIVRKLHNSAIVLGWELIKFVDNVITPA
jgi:hypothetical protein